MTNHIPVQSASNLEDHVLRATLREVVEYRRTGRLGDGWLTLFAATLADVVTDEADRLRTAEDAIVMAAALRWAEQG